MLSEQITVTTTATSIRALIASARGVEADVIPKKAIGTMMRYDPGETAIVSLSDGAAGGGSAAGAIILDDAIDLLSTSIGDMVPIDKALLSCNTGTVVVHIIIAQALK